MYFLYSIYNTTGTIVVTKKIEIKSATRDAPTTLEGFLNEVAILKQVTGVVFSLPLLFFCFIVCSFCPCFIISIPLFSEISPAVFN